MQKDSFLTFSKVSEGVFKDKGSRFLAFGHNVKNEDEVKQIINQYKKRFYDARHHCYAYRFGLFEDKYRMNDDGEPSGTAGKPIFGQIQSNELYNSLIVVVRYFGGTLLGTSGLINAYKLASADCIANASLREEILTKRLKIEFPYDLTNEVMRVIKDTEAKPGEQFYDKNCTMEIAVRLNNFNNLRDRLAKLHQINFLKEENNKE